MLYQTDDTRIQEIKELLPPVALLERFPISHQAAALTFTTRDAIHRILTDQDDRLLVVIGPCSIHDSQAAKEYAEFLKPLRESFCRDLLIVMRVYFEKPRTTVGWKGMINDPYLNNSYEINEGLRIARQLLLRLNEMGIPASTEYLDMITPQYFADLISWGAIGARTTESQVHRELASGLSCPVGFKNGTDGNLKIAIDAIRSTYQPHHFLSVTKFGHSAIISTSGNKDCHLILRGGKVPNYTQEHVQSAISDLTAAGLPSKVMIDFSHANSSKDYRRQMVVCTDVCRQISAGNQAIFGVMAESNLVEGRQDLIEGKIPLYGQSITDSCLGQADSVALLNELAAAVAARRRTRE